MNINTLRDLLELNKEVLGWLNTQRGMIPKDYAKDLAKLISRVELSIKEGEENGRVREVLEDIPSQGRKS
jgi:hypothetical protein